MSDLSHFADAVNTGAMVPGYTVDNELSGPDRKVYHGNGDTVVAFHNTRNGWSKNALRDLGTDIGMVFGAQSKLNRFKNSLDVTRRAQEKYGGTVRVTGHSLGGSQAAYVASKLNLPGASYNAYMDPSHVPYYAKHLPGNFKVNVSLADPIGMSATPLLATRVRRNMNVVLNHQHATFAQAIGGGLGGGAATLQGLGEAHSMGNFKQPNVGVIRETKQVPFVRHSEHPPSQEFVEKELYSRYGHLLRH